MTNRKGCLDASEQDGNNMPINIMFKSSMRVKHEKAKRFQIVGVPDTFSLKINSFIYKFSKN